MYVERTMGGDLLAEEEQRGQRQDVEVCEEGVRDGVRCEVVEEGCYGVSGTLRGSGGGRGGFSVGEEAGAKWGDGLDEEDLRIHVVSFLSRLCWFGGAGVELTVAEARTKNARNNVGTTIIISSPGLECGVVLVRILWTMVVTLSACSAQPSSVPVDPSRF